VRRKGVNAQDARDFRDGSGDEDRYEICFLSQQENYGIKKRETSLFFK
jgi:hypothetical protein